MESRLAGGAEKKLKKELWLCVLALFPAKTGVERKG
jgi:hypothetical protein